MRRLICVTFIPATILCALLSGAPRSAKAAPRSDAQAQQPSTKKASVAVDPAPPLIEENCPDEDAEAGKNLYVIADEIAKDKKHPLVGELKKLAKYRAGLGSLQEFEGGGIPESPYAHFMLTFEDRAQARAAKKLFKNAGELIQDIDGYHEHEWVVPLEATMPKEAISNIARKLKDNGLVGDITDYLVGNIVIFGRCLDEKTASALQRELSERNIKSKILTLRWVETDI